MIIPCLESTGGNCQDAAILVDFFFCFDGAKIKQLVDYNEILNFRLQKDSWYTCTTGICMYLKFFYHLRSFRQTLLNSLVHHQQL